MQIILDARREESRLAIFGVSMAERILRQLDELGAHHVIVVVRRGETPVLRRDFRPRYTIAVDTCFHDGDVLDVRRRRNGPMAILWGHICYDERVLRYVLDATASLRIHSAESSLGATVLTDPPPADARLDQVLEDGLRSGAIQNLGVEQMDSYVREVRRLVRPFMIDVHGPDMIRTLENQLYEQTFKGGMDFIATYGYKIPVRGLVRLLAPTRVTPNWVTALSILCSMAAVPLFAIGWLWTGLAVAFTFILCDSLDGKLARLTIRRTPFAGKIDRLTSTPAVSLWSLAWGWHFSNGRILDPVFWVGVALFMIILADKFTRNAFYSTFGRSMLDYRPLDERIHLFSTKRTINLFILAMGLSVGLALGASGSPDSAREAPRVAFYFMALWALLTWVWHLGRFAWLWAERTGATAQIHSRRKQT